MHVHDFFQANFTLSGKCELITENGSCPVQENDLLFVAPGTPHALKYSEKYLSLCYKFYMEQPVFPPFLHVAANDFTRGVIDATKTIFETTFPSRFFGVPEGTIILPQDRYQILMEYYLTGVVATLFQHSQRYSGPLARIYDILEKQSLFCDRGCGGMSLFEKSFFRIDQADDGAYGKRLSESAPGGKRKTVFALFG